jgi:hypothetical protein
MVEGFLLLPTFPAHCTIEEDTVNLNGVEKR